MPLSKVKNRDLMREMREIRYNRKLNAEVVVPKPENKHNAEPVMSDYGIQLIDADGNLVYEEG